MAEVTFEYALEVIHVLSLEGQGTASPMAGSTANTPAPLKATKLQPPMVYARAALA
jgi:hypothetical protein